MAENRIPVPEIVVFFNEQIDVLNANRGELNRRRDSVLEDDREGLDLLAGKVRGASDVLEALSGFIVRQSGCDPDSLNSLPSS